MRQPETKEQFRALFRDPSVTAPAALIEQAAFYEDIARTEVGLEIDARLRFIRAATAMRESAVSAPEREAVRRLRNTPEARQVRAGAQNSLEAVLAHLGAAISIPPPSPSNDAVMNHVRIAHSILQSITRAQREIASAAAAE